jgi:hypothetical protein
MKNWEDDSSNNSDKQAEKFQNTNLKLAQLQTKTNYWEERFKNCRWPSETNTKYRQVEEYLSSIKTYHLQPNRTKNSKKDFNNLVDKTNNLKSD